MTPQIPKTQIAAVVPELRAPLQLRKNHPVCQPSELAPGECLVKLECTGVCHTDLHAKQGDWPLTPNLPLIGGHEGVGVVVAIGDHTPESGVKIGDRVGIKWLAYSCLMCEYCRKGLEQNCVKALLSGFTTDGTHGVNSADLGSLNMTGSYIGTFAQYTKSWVNHVTPIPKSLKSSEAASLLCAGVTVYRALLNSNTHIGDWVVIPGSGGGLGHLAIQYATAMGLRVLAVDTSEEKKKLSLDLGAEHFIDFKLTKDLARDINDATGGEGAHAAIITASNPAAYQLAVEYIRCGGTLVAVGLPAGGKLGADIFFTVYKSLKIVGSYVGNRQDAIEALDIAAAGKVKVHFFSKPLSELERTYKGLEEGKIVGRVVLDVPQ